MVAGLGVQWLGVAGAMFMFSGSLLTAFTEGVTAAACLAVMWLTLNSLEEIPPEKLVGLSNVEIERLKRAQIRARRRKQAQVSVMDQLWPLVIVLAGGMAGFVLARLFPIGGGEGALLAFYWTALGGMLALLIDGAREPVKLAAGLLALLNGTFLLAAGMGVGVVSNQVALSLMAACRIALAALLAYSWAMLKWVYDDLDLSHLFRKRDETPDTPAALVAREEPGPNE